MKLKNNHPMNEAFKNIPKVVRKQIRLRMAVGAVFLLFFITTWISTGQFRIGLMLLFFCHLNTCERWGDDI